jgi:hypothetical protein
MEEDEYSDEMEEEEEKESPIKKSKKDTKG